MTKLLLKNADYIVTMDKEKGELTAADILIHDGKIVSIGSNLSYTDDTEIFNAKGYILTPGLINTHHHLFQTLTRCVPAGQNAELFGWLKSLYPIWAQMLPKDFYRATQIGLAELALSGCTMSSDHLYLFPNGTKLENTIDAAKTIGIRFHPTRGSMSIGESKGGLPPDSLVENEDNILLDCESVISQFHNPSENSMLRIGIAPCSPFSVSQELMHESAVLARKKKVLLHTHLAENDEDITYSLQHFGCRPGQYVKELDWIGDDVWHAHCVKLNDEEIQLFAESSTGIAHCPSSNCRLASGIAPLRSLLDNKVKVGLGVDGSASSDTGHLLNEARQAMLLQRVANNASTMTAREALEIATLGGAKILGREKELGSLTIGKRADIAIWQCSQIATSGAWDAVASLIFCAPHKVRHLLVEGNFVVSEGKLIGVNEQEIINSAQKTVLRLLNS